MVSKSASLLKFSDVPNTNILSALPSALSKKGSPESVLAHSPVIEMADLQRKKRIECMEQANLYLYMHIVLHT